MDMFGLLRTVLGRIGCVVLYDDEVECLPMSVLSGWLMICVVAGGVHFL